MPSRSALHTLKTSVIIHTFFKMASGGEVNVVFFMEEAQKYDCLYNEYTKSYKDKYIKVNCWTKIGEKFDMSAADAEKKFKNVRTGYGRYLKKVKAIPSGSGRDAVPTPQDFAGLDWLQKYISHRPTVSNIVIRPKLSCRVDKNPATAAIIWKHRIATIAQNKNFVSYMFFDDSSDSSDGSDYMETRLKSQS